MTRTLLAGTPPRSGRRPDVDPPDLAVADWVQHPSPSAKSNPAIGSVHHRAGVLYLGYGDWNLNIGPIDLATIDLATGATGVAVSAAPTESLAVVREMGGHLYYPWVDPKVAAGGIVTDAPDGAWKAITLPAMVHVFDVEMVGTDLWACGSAGSGVITYRSQDGGSTWTDMLHPGAGVIDRVYSMAVAGGSLKAASAGGSSGYYSIRSWAADVWSDWYTPGPTGRTVYQHNHRVMVSDAWWRNDGLVTSDDRWVPSFRAVQPVQAIGGQVLGIEARRTLLDGSKVSTIYSTPADPLTATQSVEWEPVCDVVAPSPTLTFAVVGGDIYTGHADGWVRKAPWPIV